MTTQTVQKWCNQCGNCTEHRTAEQKLPKYTLTLFTCTGCNFTHSEPVTAHEFGQWIEVRRRA